MIDADGGSSRSAEKDITDITIDAIAGGETGVSAVDLVTRQASISNLTIRGVSGQFGKYGVAFSSGTGEGSVAGRIDNVAISNVTAVSSATSGRPADGIIWFREGVPDIGSIRIESLFRGEDVSYQNAVDTISVGAGVHIGRLELYDVLQTVAGSQELLAVDQTAVIDECVQGGSRHDAISLKVPVTRVVLPAQQGQAITNSLSSVFAQWIQTRQNPVETSLGVWTIRQSGVRQSGGDLLDAFYDNGNGIMGFRHEMVGGVASTVYPKAYLNTANVAEANDASEDDLQPGECYGHPGATDEEGLQIIFQPFLAGDYGIQGSVRSVAKRAGDGVTFVGARFGSWEDEFFRVEHSATVRSASFATEAYVESGERLSFVLNCKSEYTDDGTGLDLRIARGPIPSAKKLSADRIDVISNLNALACARGIYGYPDETVVNGLAVSFGRRDLPEGAFSSMGRFVLPGADFVGWRNGTDASAGATAETSTLPYALLNIAGTERCPPFADRFVRADEVALAPGCERAGVLRLVARRPFAGRQEFVFGFRDLQTDIAQGEGTKCRFLLRDEEVGRIDLPNGGKWTYTLAVDGLETGDAIDVVVQPLNETVSAQTGNLTAISLKWNRAVQGLALFLR